MPNFAFFKGLDDAEVSSIVKYILTPSITIIPNWFLWKNGCKHFTGERRLDISSTFIHMGKDAGESRSTRLYFLKMLVVDFSPGFIPSDYVKSIEGSLEVCIS